MVCLLTWIIRLTVRPVNARSAIGEARLNLGEAGMTCIRDSYRSAIGGARFYQSLSSLTGMQKFLPSTTFMDLEIQEKAG
jgi:hypothetical protein